MSRYRCSPSRYAIRSSMIPPRSFVSSVYCAWPVSSRSRSFESSPCSSSCARGPSTSSSPMCETSKTPASVRTARCSWITPVVLHRHLPARERHHPRTERDVPVVERRLEQRLPPCRADPSALRPRPGRRTGSTGPSIRPGGPPLRGGLLLAQEGRHVERVVRDLEAAAGDRGATGPARRSASPCGAGGAARRSRSRSPSPGARRRAPRRSRRRR